MACLRQINGTVVATAYANSRDEPGQLLPGLNIERRDISSVVEMTRFQGPRL